MTPPTTFEDRLLEQLQHAVADRPAIAPPTPRRLPRRRLALAGAGCAATVTAIAIAAGSGGATTEAYAVQARPNGNVEVSINELSDARGLESKLAASGVPAVVDFDPADRAACSTTAPAQNATGKDGVDSLQAYETADGGVWAELPPGKPWADPSAHSKKENATGDLSNAAVAEAGGTRFLVDPALIQSGEKLVITTSDGTVKTLTMTVADQASAAGCVAP